MRYSTVCAYWGITPVLIYTQLTAYGCQQIYAHQSGVGCRSDMALRDNPRTEQGAPPPLALNSEMALFWVIWVLYRELYWELYWDPRRPEASFFLRAIGGAERTQTTDHGRPEGSKARTKDEEIEGENKPST
jgi:hypothetical protein